MGDGTAVTQNQDYPLQNGTHCASNLPGNNDLFLLTSGQPLKKLSINPQFRANDIQGIKSSSLSIPKVVAVSPELVVVANLDNDYECCVYKLKNNNSELVNKINVEDEIMQLSFFDKGSILVSTVDGLIKYAIPSFEIIWQSPKPAKIFAYTAVCPKNQYIAAILGAFSGQHYALIGADGDVLLDYRSIPAARGHASAYPVWSDCGSKLALVVDTSLIVLSPSEGI